MALALLEEDANTAGDVIRLRTNIRFLEQVMMRFTSVAVAAALALGSVAFMGCESDNQTDLPRDEAGTTAGGNGAFGESPARPGDYSNSSSGYSSSGYNAGDNGSNR